MSTRSKPAGYARARRELHGLSSVITVDALAHIAFCRCGWSSVVLRSPTAAKKEHRNHAEKATAALPKFSDQAELF